MAQNDTSDIIGSTEVIDFPKHGYKDIPAKVDTGADVSAVWASNIKVTPEGLQFTLFDKHSRFYTGEPTTVTGYRTATVKNSSGKREVRYKVRLLARVGTRKIRAWFTLANRANMQYPVLLGRRLLNNKFVVDVSMRKPLHTAHHPAQVLFLVSQADRPRMQELADNIASQLSVPSEIVVCPYPNLTFKVETNNVVVHETITQSDIASFDLVYFKSHRQYYEFAVSAAQYLASKRVKFIDSELGRYISYDKLSELLNLALAGLPIPAAYCASKAVMAQQYAQLRKELGSPFVCKEVHADRGHKNYLVDSRHSFDEIIAGAEADDVFMAQQYIENDGFLRVHVFNADVASIIKYDAVGHTDSAKRHLNKPKHGTNARLVNAHEVPLEVHDLAIQASRRMKRQVAGVDLLQDTSTEKWYVLEVNSNPQIVSGSHVQEKQAKLASFIDFELNR